MKKFIFAGYVLLGANPIFALINRDWYCATGWLVACGMYFLVIRFGRALLTTTRGLGDLEGAIRSVRDQAVEMNRSFGKSDR